MFVESGCISTNIEFKGTISVYILKSLASVYQLVYILHH